MVVSGYVRGAACYPPRAGPKHPVAIAFPSIAGNIDLLVPEAGQGGAQLRPGVAGLVVLPGAVLITEEHRGQVPPSVPGAIRVLTEPVVAGYRLGVGAGENPPLLLCRQ